MLGAEIPTPPLLEADLWISAETPELQSALHLSHKILHQFNWNMNFEEEHFCLERQPAVHRKP